MASDEHPEIIEKVKEIEEDRIVLSEDRVIPEIHIQTASHKTSLEKGEETGHVSQKFVDESTKLVKPTDEEQLTLSAVFQTDSTRVKTDDNTEASEEKENELEITTIEENEDDNDEKQMKIPETKRKGSILWYLEEVIKSEKSDVEKTEEEQENGKESDLGPVGNFAIKTRNTEDLLNLEIFGESHKVTDFHFESSSESDTSTDVPETLPIAIDRQVYIEQYKSLNTEKLIAKRRNILLQKKLIEYFKKRKVDNIFKEDEPMGLDAEQKYNKRLLEYSALKVEEDKEKQEMNQEISKLRGQKEELAAELDNQLKALIKRQTEIGLALKHSKTGKLIPPENVSSCRCTKMLSSLGVGALSEDVCEIPSQVIPVDLGGGRSVERDDDKVYENMGKLDEACENVEALPCKGKDVEATGQGSYPLGSGNMRQTARGASLRPEALPCKGKDVEAAGQGRYPLGSGNMRQTARGASLRLEAFPCKGKDVEAAGQGRYPLGSGNMKQTARGASFSVLRETSLNIKEVVLCISLSLLMSFDRMKHSSGARVSGNSSLSVLGHQL
uniref:Uncharacterized protein n=1 Tax=Timema bartmani TaxID=61472 RepID=A0A7R9EXT9_9NEOP|nr:unnamed protein product [Timema bartmani]